MRSVIGRILVIGLVLWSWVPVVSMAVAFAHPVWLVLGGDSTIQIDRHGGDDSLVTSARSGAFRTGDRFATRSLSLAEALALYGYTRATPSDRLALDVLRDGTRRTITLTPVPYDVFTGSRPIVKALWALSPLLSAIVMTAAGALLLARPTLLMRSLFLAFFGSLVGAVDPRPLTPTGLAVFIVITVGYGFGAYCTWESVRAATLFPDGVPGPFARVLLRVAAVLAAFTGLWSMCRNSAGVLYPIGSTPDWLVSDSPTSATLIAETAASIAVNFLAAAALGLRYRASSPDDRLKIRAVLLAAAVIAGVSLLTQIEGLVVPFHHGTTVLDEITDVFGLVQYLLPVTVIAAIVRHRLFGIRFVVDRALVYGGLALLLVTPLRVVNVVLAARFPHTRVATIAEVIVAIGLAVAIEPMRRAVERVVRGLMFRKHEEALAAVAHLGAAARSATTIADLAGLVTGAGDRLDLAGAALVLDGDETLRLDGDLPNDPALTVTLRFGRHDVGRIVFGAHRNGADLDPAEASALRAFSADVERSAEGIVAERLQAEVRELRAQLAEPNAWNPGLKAT